MRFQGHINLLSPELMLFHNIAASRIIRFPCVHPYPVFKSPIKESAIRLLNITHKKETNSLSKSRYVDLVNALVLIGF